MDETQRLYVAHMPDVFGHGLQAFSLVSPEDAKSKVRRAYDERIAQFGRQGEQIGKFSDRWDWFGGVIHEVNVNKVYDSF